jgi:hypothetical protein
MFEFTLQKYEKIALGLWKTIACPEAKKLYFSSPKMLFVSI